jgi:hypothetical protein
MKPIISAIDKFMTAIHGLEISEILTPHQRWFVRMYGKEILDAFLLLQKPKSIKEYREGWECFQQVTLKSANVYLKWYLIFIIASSYSYGRNP